MNVYGAPLELCSGDPLTGYLRDGCCSACERDHGQHTICVELDDAFLRFSREHGNDLVTPRPEFGFPGLVAGNRWCVCLPRWIEACQAGVVARVNLRATHQAVLESVPLETLERCALRDA